ncbi:hypothetical protein PHYPSEUDO_000747 [Phytophthora pseudosyringae]|uniref:Uncharacterized protein n=1 Tax=Phytophthora pseudosyringae TaxID=221518 RepID=A0A8T1WKU7_9STRA|nr:hypothetical protein PHYPSEUDO_000747 [Phytophthora pseudosyringae]
MITIVILQESITLQDPAAGWKVNYGFWIRVALLVGFSAPTMATQLRYLVEGVVISSRQLLFITASMVVVYTAATLLVAATTVFPIPFQVLSMSFVYFSLLIVAVVAAVGRNGLNAMLSHTNELARCVCYMSSQLLVAVAYPAYQALFNAAVKTRYELLVFLLLPGIKIVLKNFVALSMTHMEDIIPESVIFTVDFFNSLYLATCMQSASSTTSVVVIVAIDLVQNALALTELHRSTRSILARLREVLPGQESDDLVAALCTLCRSPAPLEDHPVVRLTTQSCLPHRLSMADREMVVKRQNDPLEEQVVPLKLSSSPSLAEMLESRPAKVFKSRSKAWLCRSRRRHSSSITPMGSQPRLTQRRQISVDFQQALLSKRAAVLRDVLEVLFTCECLVLTEYVEAVIPALYGMYILLMVHLPSARYHNELVGVTQETIGDTVHSIFVYALLEAGSFALLSVLMLRNCGMRALYQLSFVLETQASLIQGKLVMWMLMTLTYRVVHFGVDFTFTFAWIGG